MIEELANIPNKGNLSNAPKRHINSPMKLKESGAPQFAKDNMKNNIEKIGIAKQTPL